MPRFARAMSLSAFILVAALSALSLPGRASAQDPQPTSGPRPTPARPTAEANQSECAGFIEGTTSASTVRVCDTLTTTVRLQAQCPYCLGGVSFVFVQPEFAGANIWMQTMNRQILNSLEDYQRTYESTFKRPFLVQAGVVQYSATVARVVQPMTTRLNVVLGAFDRTRYGLTQDGGPYYQAAQEAVKLLRTAPSTSEARAQGGHDACVELVAFYGSREGSTMDTDLYQEAVQRAGNTIRDRTKALFVGCTAEEVAMPANGCGWFLYMTPETRYLATRFDSIFKFKNAMQSFLRDAEDKKPPELVREVWLSQRLPAGLDYLPGTGIPEPTDVITAADGSSELRWHIKPIQTTDFYTVTYSTKPNREGQLPIEGDFELRDFAGLRHVVPMASQPITVSGLCLPPTPTPSNTPDPTDTPEPTSTPEPTATRTPTPTPSPTRTRAPAMFPALPREEPLKALYFPLLLNESCKPKQQRVDVALVLDTSTSMAELTGAGRSKLVAAQDAARTFLDELQLAEGDRAALVTFNSEATLAQPLTGDRAAMDAAIAAMAIAPQTCLVCGIQLADEELRGPRAQADHSPVLILLTDGRSNPRPVEEAVAASAAAKAAGVLIFTIGIGDDLDVGGMAAIASRPELFYRSADAEDLAEIYRGISRSIPCQPDAFWAGR